MDARFWRKVAGGIAIGSVLGSIVPAAATAYFWDPVRDLESLLETPSADASATEKAKAEQKTAPEKRKKVHWSSKKGDSRQFTAPQRSRTTEADKLADVIMGYIKARRNSFEPNEFPSYSEYAANTTLDRSELPLNFYQNDRHYLLSEERFVMELSYCFRYENFGCIELLLPTEEDNFSRNFRRRMVEEITGHYGLYLDHVIEDAECSTYESDALFNRMIYFSLFPQRHEDGQFSLGNLTALREKEKQACLKCDLDCSL